MRKWLIPVALALSTQPVIGAAQQEAPLPVPAARQLRGLHASDATALIAKLQDAQQRLKAGEFQAFELFAGSVASYDMTKTSPRDAFLQARFEQVWQIERVGTDNPLWQPYKLAYAPDGLGKLYWDVEVVLGINGQIQRVTMLYKPPAPF